MFQEVQETGTTRSIKTLNANGANPSSASFSKRKSTPVVYSRVIENSSKSATVTVTPIHSARVRASSGSLKAVGQRDPKNGDQEYAAVSFRTSSSVQCHQPELSVPEPHQIIGSNVSAQHKKSSSHNDVS
jgi:hypothetical protein